MHFSDDMTRRIFTQIIHYLYIFGEVSVKVFVPFPNVFLFLFTFLSFDFCIYFGWSFCLFVFKSGDMLSWFNSVQSLSHIWRFTAPWIAARQASLSITNPWSSLKLMSIESVMPYSHLILCSSPFPPAPNPSQDQSLFQWVNSSHEVTKLPEIQL